MGRQSDDEEYEDEEESEGNLLARLYHSPWRRGSVVPLILLLFGFGAWRIWQKYEDEVLGHHAYLLDAQHIQYTSPPEWLTRDILAEVIKNGSLESRKIHETGLTVRIANAFEHHPWVKRVDRVRLHYPAKLDVEVQYRQPVAMVALPDDNPNDTEVPRLPVDSEGFLLPPEDFITESRELRPEFDDKFPRIDVGGSGPAGVDGAAWGDPVVEDAAKLAELLCQDWASLKSVLYQIELSSQPTTTQDFDIRGRPDIGPVPPGLLVHWGRAPGKELAMEPTAAEKLAILKKRINESKLTGHQLLGVIDLRSTTSLRNMGAREQEGPNRLVSSPE